MGERPRDDASTKAPFGISNAVYFVVLFIGYSLLTRIFNTVELFRVDALELHPLGPPFSLPFILGEELIVAIVLALLSALLWKTIAARALWLALFGAYLLWLAANQLAFEHFFGHVDYVLSSEAHDLNNLSSSIRESVDLFFAVQVVVASAIIVLLVLPFRPRFVRFLAGLIYRKPGRTAAALALYLVLTVTFVAAFEQHGLDRPFPVAYIESYLDSRAEEAEMARAVELLPPPPKRAEAIEPDAGAPIAKKRRKLNVVLYLMESTSYRESSLAPGAAYDTTPFVAKLAKRSLLFSNYYCIVAASTRSFFSLLTGVYPYMDRAPDLAKYSQLTIPTLPDILHGAGYATAFFASSDSMFEGLDTFLTARKYDHYVDKNLLQQETGSETDYWGVDEEIMIDRALEWIRSKKDSGQSFYVSYNALYPHHPFRVPDQHAHLGEKDWGEPRVRARFRASLRYADWAVERFYNGLKELDLLGDTLFIVTPDHGETFGDLHKKNFVHAEYCFEEDSRIFLVLHNPEVLGAPQESTRLGSHLDLLPTILAILGIDPAMDIDGQSLLSREHGERKMFHFSRRQMAVRDGDYKLLVPRKTGKGRPVLYNLANDPTEQKNIAPYHQEKTESLKKLVKQWQASVAAAFKDRVAAAGLSQAEISEIVDKHRKERFAGTRVLFETVSLCAGAGNTSCGSKGGARTFPKGRPLTVHAKIRKYAAAKVKVQIFEKRGKRVYTELQSLTGTREVTFPAISTSQFEPGTQYRMRVSTVSYHAIHDTKYFLITIAD